MLSFKNLPIRFGSVVQFTHTVTRYKICATKVGNQEDSSELHKCVFLTSNEELQRNDVGNIASCWYVLSRYRAKEHGDVLMNGDYVVYRNALYLDLYLSTTDENFVCCGNWSYIKERSEWQIFIHRHAVIDDDNLFFGDYIKLQFIETPSYLNCHLNDENELESMVSPIGQACRMLCDEESNEYKVVALHSQRLDCNSFKFTGIWQVIPTRNSYNGDLTGVDAIMPGTVISLRNMSCGKYLSTNAYDSKLITANMSDNDRTEFILRKIDYTSSGNPIKFGNNLFLEHRGTGKLINLGVDSFTNSCDDSDPVEDYNDENNQNGWYEYRRESKIGLSYLDRSSIVSSQCLFRMQKIQKERLRECFYLSRYLPLAKTCVSIFQTAEVQAHSYISTTFLLNTKYYMMNIPFLYFAHYYIAGA